MQFRRRDRIGWAFGGCGQRRSSLAKRYFCRSSFLALSSPNGQLYTSNFQLGTLVRLWRVSRYASIDGAGGLRVGDRWHSRGHPIVYACVHPAAALLEWLAHLELDASQVPATIPYVVLRVPDDIHSERAEPLPDRWELRPAATRRLGDAWLVAARSALLYVPSAILPETDNVAINPLHADAASITVERSFEHRFDVRIAPRGGGSIPRDARID